MNTKALCVIPARGGSKRIPRKNIRLFSGRPIIAWVIEIARLSGCFNEIMVSTEDEEIAKIAREWGASVPFMRRKETADDYSTTSDVLLEVIQNYHKQGQLYDLACCLYPTAALLSPDRLREGKKMMQSDEDLETVVSIIPFSHPIERALVIDNNRISWLQPQHTSTRTQDLRPAFHDAGQFYWFRISSFVKNPVLLGKSSAPIKLHKTEVCDIDNEYDWSLAEAMFHSLKNLR